MKRPETRCREGEHMEETICVVTKKFTKCISVIGGPDIRDSCVFYSKHYSFFRLATFSQTLINRSCLPNWEVLSLTNYLHPPRSNVRHLVSIVFLCPSQFPLSVSSSDTQEHRSTCILSRVAAAATIPNAPVSLPLRFESPLPHPPPRSCYTPRGRGRRLDEPD